MFFASRFWLNAYNVGVIWLAASAAVAAAILNAGSSVLQRLATGKPDAKDLFSRHFARAVTLSRLFLLGLGLEIGGFVMQAVALGNGSLVLVEPILTCDLIFLLIFMFIKAGKMVALRQQWLSDRLHLQGDLFAFTQGWTIASDSSRCRCDSLILV